MSHEIRREKQYDPAMEPRPSPAEVGRHFAGYRFGEPCTAEQVARAESILRQPIPLDIRRLYLDFNGFLGPTDSPFFWPLFEQTPGGPALVEMNLFYRNDSVFPHELTSMCLFFGDAGGGSQWGVKADLPGKIIVWDAEWDDFEVAGTDILQVWLEEKRKYDELA